MLNSVATRIQTRLKRQGFKVVLGEIKDRLKSTVIDINNITKQEETNTTEYFLSSATELAVIGDDSEKTEITTTPDIYISSIQDIDQPQPAPLATATKNELVSQAANNLNIELSTAEIEAIATNFNASSDDFTTTLEELKSAILAFINHKVITNNLMITNTINEIYETATAGFESNNQHLNDGLSQLNKALTQQSLDFKSRLKNTLEKFKLPAA